MGSHFDGIVAEPTELVDWEAPPTLQWTIDVGDGYGIGSIAGQRYYQSDMDVRQTFQERQQSERLRCFDLTTGELVWSQSNPIAYRDLMGYENGPRSSPTIDGDLIFTMGVGGRLTCRQLESGTEVWAVETAEKYNVIQNFFGAGSSPLVLGDAVIVTVGGSPDADRRVAPGQLDRVSPNGSGVVAFDRLTGRELWKGVDDLASYSNPRPIVLDGKTFVLVFARDHLWCVDPSTGKSLWQFRHRARIRDSVNAMTPIVQGNRIFISECYQVGSVLLEANQEGVSVVWQDPPNDRRRQAMRCHWATPVLLDGFLYGCNGRNGPDSDFRCIEMATGEVHWIDPRRERSSVTAVGKFLLVMGERGELQVLSVDSTRFQLLASHLVSEVASDGDVQPAIGVSYPCWSAPVVVGNRVIVRGNRQVACLEFPVRATPE